MKCYDFIPLIDDMKLNNIDKEHYFFDYNGFRFDVILSITYHGYEILVAVHTHNWGCVLNMNKNYNIEIPNEVYFSLCKLLNLNWSKNHFSSAAFLQLLSKNSPKKSKCTGVDYLTLRNYLPYRQVVKQLRYIFVVGTIIKKIKEKLKILIRRNFSLESQLLITVEKIT